MMHKGLKDKALHLHWCLTHPINWGKELVLVGAFPCLYTIISADCSLEYEKKEQHSTTITCSIWVGKATMSKIAVYRLFL